MLSLVFTGDAVVSVTIMMAASVAIETVMQRLIALYCRSVGS